MLDSLIMLDINIIDILTYNFFIKKIKSKKIKINFIAHHFLKDFKSLVRFKKGNKFTLSET